MSSESSSIKQLEDDLKTWERGFELEFGYKPTSKDIAVRPSIVNLYKKYQIGKSSQVSRVPFFDEHVHENDTTVLAYETDLSTEVSSCPNANIACNSQPKKKIDPCSDFFEEGNGFFDYFGDDAPFSKSPQYTHSTSNELVELDKPCAISKNESFTSFFSHRTDGFIESEIFNNANDIKSKSSNSLDNRVSVTNNELETSSDNTSSTNFENAYSQSNSPQKDCELTKNNTDLQLMLPNYFSVPRDETLFSSKIIDSETKSSQNSEIPQSFHMKLNDVPDPNFKVKKKSHRCSKHSLKNDDYLIRLVSEHPSKVKNSRVKKRKNFRKILLKKAYKTALQKKSTKKIPSSACTNLDGGAFIENEEICELPLEIEIEDCNIEILEELRRLVDQGKFVGSHLSRLLKQFFNFDNFREGQLDTIQNILQKKSTLFISPTGSGKSLCYLIPTYAFSSGITLVISPLLSLMMDQLKHLPKGLCGVALGSHLSKELNDQNLEKIKRGLVQIVFVSPEKVSSSSFIDFLKENNIGINIACIDEAHCISSWSHNFRPSYLLLNNILVEQLSIERLLAFTATATKSVERLICSKLSISNVIRCKYINDHLELHVLEVTDVNRFDKLEALLRSPCLASKSTIIYVMFQKDADDLCSILNYKNFSVGSYHAGKTFSERRAIQSDFESDRIRILTATTAFGMGLNKSNVRAIIHYSIPKNVESYIQEIGRAGRDNQKSFCYLFFNYSDFFRLKSLIHSDTQDRYNIKLLLASIWPQDSSVAYFKKRTVLLKLREIMLHVDMKLPVIKTFLTWLHENHLITIFPETCATILLKFLAVGFEFLCSKSKLLQQVYGIVTKSKDGYSFSLERLANLREESLENTRTALGQICELYEIEKVEMDLAFHVEVNKSLTSEALDEIISELTKRNFQMEKMHLEEISYMTQIANPEYDSLKIHQLIEDYFSGTMQLKTKDETKGKYDHSELVSSIKSILLKHGDVMKTARHIVRIFHALESPKFPKSEWNCSPFWGRYKNVQYEVLMEIAQRELLDFIHKNFPI